MKKSSIYFVILIFTFFAFGCGLFLMKRKWLIVHWVPSYKKSETLAETLEKQVVPKKNIQFYYWQDDALKSTEEPLVWLASKTERIKLLVGNWLTHLYEERVLGKKIRIESVALSSTEQEVYLSFDQSLFLPEWPIIAKWRIIDALSRTIQSSDLGIKTIVFLVGHEQMTDAHLDFSQPWPVGGFG